MREEQEKIIVTSPGDLDIIREEFVELMRDSYVFASVTEAETLGIFSLGSEFRSKFSISRSQARRIAKLLETLGLFKFEPGIGYRFLGVSSLSLFIG